MAIAVVPSPLAVTVASVKVTERLAVPLLPSSAPQSMPRLAPVPVEEPAATGSVVETPVDTLAWVTVGLVSLMVVLKVPVAVSPSASVAVKLKPSVMLENSVEPTSWSSG